MEEILVPFRGGPPVVAEIRSTAIVSAIQTVRSIGLGERYEAAMTADQRTRLLSLAPGIWVPAEVAREHYQIVDDLHLDAATIERIGAAVGERLYKSVVGTLLKLSSEAGASPWQMLPITQRMIDMNWRGTDVAVWKRGPKEARFEWRNQPCSKVPYFVTSFASLLRTLLELLCKKAYVVPVPNGCGPTKLTCRLSWV